MRKTFHLKITAVLCCAAVFILFLAGCGNSKSKNDISIPDTSITSSVKKGTRSNTAKALVPTADGVDTDGTDLVTVDTSNISVGYVTILYSGTDEDPKIHITTPKKDDYYYHLHNNGTYEAFALTGGDGTYKIDILKNIQSDQYALEFSETYNVTIGDPLTPYLYANQYVNFTADSKATAMGEVLAYPADDDLTVIGRIYSYVAGSVSYDYEEAETVEAGYIPDPDRTLETKKGICFDYAALMAAMLRTQGIPTRLEVGYAGTAYHAWISTYVNEIGWVNGIIEFDGKNWTLMDPTFASSKGEKNVQDYIGDGTNYKTKYIY